MSQISKNSKKDDSNASCCFFAWCCGKKLKKEQMEMIVAIDEVPFDVEDVLTPDSSDVPFDVIETAQDDGRLKYLL